MKAGRSPALRLLDHFAIAPIFPKALIIDKGKIFPPKIHIDPCGMIKIRKDGIYFFNIIIYFHDFIISVLLNLSILFSFRYYLAKIRDERFFFSAALFAKMEVENHFKGEQENGKSNRFSL